MNENYYTKKEFEEIRDKIAKVITEDEELNKAFTVKRSSYEYAKKHNWNITVDVSRKNYDYLYESGTKTVHLVTKLMTKYSEFINKSENEFYFSGFDTRSDCAFYFNFQPVIIRAKQELMK